MSEIIKVYNRYERRTQYTPNEIIEYEDYAEIILYDKKSIEKSRAIIDKEDIELVKQYKWYDSKGYTMTTIKNNKIPLHRMLMNVIDSDIICDHKDRNPMNNRRSNLRLTDKTRNNENIGLRKSNTSGITGVSWNKRDQKWRARICVNSKEVGLGSYINFEDAVKARMKGELKYYGEYAPQAHEYIKQEAI